MKVRYVISLIAVLGILTQLGCKSGSSCSDCNPLTYSTGIAIDASGNVWIITVPSVGSPVIETLSPTGKIMGSYSVGAYPTGIAIDAIGNIWVTHTIKTFYSAGKSFSSDVSVLDFHGNIIEEYNIGLSSYPTNITIDAIGNIWVINSGNETVTNFSSTGLTISTYVLGVIPSGITIDAQGYIWIITNNGTVTKLNSTGVAVGTYTIGSNLHGIGIDPFGNVWIGSSYSTVTVLSSNGAIIKTYNIAPSTKGIAIDSSGGVWVTNYDSASVTELDLTGIKKVYHVCKTPLGIAIDAVGNVWVTCSGNGNVTPYISKLIGVAKGPQYFPYTGSQFPGGGNY